MGTHRAAVILFLAIALVVPAVGSAAPLAKKKRKRGPAVAVWDLHVDDDHRAEAWHWYGQISEAIDQLEDLRADPDRLFEPAVRPSEGLDVASQSASRWLEGAWVAYRGREYQVAVDFATDALALVDGYPASRMPDGLVRDLELMVARSQVALGREAQARAALRAALLLDPWWVARDGWEHQDVIDLWAEVSAERAEAPPATLAVRTTEPFTTVLIYGVPHGETGPTGELDLHLPPGIYEVTGRREGYADSTERVHLRPHDVAELDLPMEIRNSPRFVEGVIAALADPAAQRRSSVWKGLEVASEAVTAEAILVARFDSGSRTLQVGLYLPGRSGWGFFREVELSGDLGRDQLGIEDTIEDLLLAIETARRPLLVADAL